MLKDKIVFFFCAVFVLGLIGFGECASANKRNDFVVAMPKSFQPYCHVHDDGSVSGFAVDVMAAVAGIAGLKVRYLVKDDWAATINALSSGEADIIPNLGITDERAKIFAFTRPYEVYNFGIFVQENNKDINAFDDLVSRSIGVVGFNNSGDHVGDCFPMAKIKIYESNEDALDGLFLEEVDALICLEPVLWQLARTMGVENFIKVAGGPVLKSERAMAVRKEDIALQKRLDKAMKSLRNSPEYTKIYTKWYGVRHGVEYPWILLVSMAALALGLAFVFAFWRYLTVNNLNRQLAALISKQEKTAFKLNQAMFTLEKAGEAVYWMDLDGSFIYVNEAAMESLGYTWQELSQMHVWDIDPDYQEEVWPEFVDYLEIGVSMNFKTSHIRKDGTIFPVEIKSQYLSYDEKLFICAFVQDITEREMVEKALLESEMRQRAILENVADSIITIGENGVIESFNFAAEKAFGYYANEVIGKNISMLMPEPESLCHDEFLARYIEEGNIKKLCGGPRETHGVRKDKLIFPIDLSVSEMVFEGKRIFVGVVRDISERKQNAEAIIRQKSELEAARQADELKSKFLAMVSHELRTPLTPIIGFAERILRKPPPREKVELFAKHICQNARHLQEIINDLLDFSKIEAGKMPLDIKMVDFLTIIDQVQSGINPLVEGKNLQLKIEVPTDLPELAVDILRVKQILLNLLSNAVKFTPNGGEIFVSAVLDGEMVLVMVKDTGKGISPEDQLLIFDHFVQVQRQQQEQQGTGLGLTIAKKLVNLHGGTIWVESMPGDGTAFFFTLPTRAEVSDG